MALKDDISVIAKIQQMGLEKAAALKCKYLDKGANDAKQDIGQHPSESH